MIPCSSFIKQLKWKENILCAKLDTPENNFIAQVGNPQKSYFLMVGSLREEGGLKARQVKKIDFLKLFYPIR